MDPFCSIYFKCYIDLITTEESRLLLYSGDMAGFTLYTAVGKDSVHKVPFLFSAFLYFLQNLNSKQTKVK